jgi:MATE family multidrug resistance protein
MLGARWVQLGMGSALETLCGQAFGAGQVAMLGVYLQRSWIVLAVAGILMVPLYVFAEPLLLAIGQDPHVAREAGRFALYILPGCLSYAVNFPTAKFLQAQSKVMVLAWIGVAGLFFHIGLSYFLVTVLEWGLPGAAAAYDLSLWAVALAQAAYIIGWCKDGWRGWSMAAFHDMWAFVKLSLESAVMLCLEVWYLSMITVLTGHLQDAQMAVDSLGIWSVYLAEFIPTVQTSTSEINALIFALIQHERRRMGGYYLHGPQCCYQCSCLQ